MEITGTIVLDGQPLAEVELALVDYDGQTTAIARSDHAGRFSLPPAATSKQSWVVAKLQTPVIGAVTSPVTASTPIALAVSSAASAMLTVDIALPQGAEPVDWYEVSITPTALAGVPLPTLRTLTLDGMGPARSTSYVKQRITGTHAQFRVLPGTYQVHAAHVIDGALTRSPPASWVSNGAVLDDGRTLAADLDRVPVDVHRDTHVRVTMVPARD